MRSPTVCSSICGCERRPRRPFAGWQRAGETTLELYAGSGRLSVLGKLFRLIQHGLPAPMIGSGSNRYQMAGVEDCVRAALLVVAAGCPPGPFNLGSREPPTTRRLLEGIIAHASSRSKLMSAPASLLKPVLGALDAVGLTLLYPEQYEIADVDVVLDTSATVATLGWVPQHGDVEIMNAAYDAFVAAAS